MKYKFRTLTALVALIGCILEAGSLTVEETTVQKSSNEYPTGPSCCADSDVLSTVHRECYSQLGNVSYPVKLNCTQYYLIYKKMEKEVHVDTQGKLVDNEEKIDPERYCSATLVQDSDNEPVFLVCFSPADYDQNMSMFFGKGVMMLISVFFLALTLFIYFIIPDLRETQDKVTSIAVGCLMMFMILLSMVQLQTSIIFHPAVCLTMAFLMYFFLISYFAWLNMVMANVWKLTVARRWKIREKAWYALNHIYAKTVALTLTAMVYIYHMRNPTFGEISCWFRTEREQSYFVYLPLSVMLSINIFLFVWTSYHLHADADTISPDRKKALRYKCMLYLKLFLLAGLIWIFEIISFHVPDARYHRSWFWIVIDSINCLHGVLIFFVLIVWRQRIKRELSGRRVLCFRCPASWAQIKDDEQEQLADEGRDYGKYDLIIK